MARDQSWLGKIKSHLSLKLIPRTSKPTHVAVLSFEIATLLSKLLALHHSLSDPSILRLKTDLVTFHGIRKIISDDDSFLLNLACAEFLHTLHLISNSTSLLSTRCTDPILRSFPESLEDFANTGRDQHGWNIAGPVLSGKDLEGFIRRVDRYITATAVLYREMEELNLLENSLGKLSSVKEDKVFEIQQKIVWQRRQIKHAKDKSLWNRSFDSVVILLAKLIFTDLSRIKLVFGIGHSYYPPPTTLPRSVSASATVFPSSDPGNPNQIFVSGPLISTTTNHTNHTNHFLHQSKSKGLPTKSGFFPSRAKALKPPPTTLGAAALALHYANLIIVLEKMIKAPHLVGLEAREDAYAMLPSSIRSSLRSRLKGVGFSATDPVLAAEWRDALARILAWLAPLAHNMIKWQNERSFEQHNLMPKSTNVMLFQTLYFANQEKTEAAITELLVGLNYIWRFEREMNAKALLECSNLFNNNNPFQKLAL